MSTAILLITHDKIGPAFVDTAKMILQRIDLPVHYVEAPADCDTSAKLEEAKKLIANEQEVLILNDVYGATPYNIAAKLENENIRVLSGLNLNMLLRALTYQELPLSELLEKASEGGVSGVRYT